jgi:hypothetical protein
MIEYKGSINKDKESSRVKGKVIKTIIEKRVRVEREGENKVRKERRKV